jgi:FMN reductase
MNTLILSSSLAKNSRSFLLCKAVEKQLTEKGNTITFVDARTLELSPTHKGSSESMEQLKKLVGEADNIIIGMGVHCYSINDSLKIILDTCFEDATGKFFAILCAAGGERSYLSTMHLTQICMNEWRMMQLPRIVYATGSDFTDNEITSKEVNERITLFSEEFHTIGNKLL